MVSFDIDQINSTSTVLKRKDDQSKEGKMFPIETKDALYSAIVRSFDYEAYFIKEEHIVDWRSIMRRCSDDILKAKNSDFHGASDYTER